MFARTERLLLRPAWPEDASALAAAIDHEQVARMLAGVPFPYTIVHAEAWTALPRDAHQPRFLIETLEGDRPALIGAIEIAGGPTEADFGYWLTPSMWGHGYATEAGRALVEMARHALPLTRLRARPFADNPASARVLRKLGFRPSGATDEARSLARPSSVADVEYILDLNGEPAAMPIAA